MTTISLTKTASHMMECQARALITTIADAMLTIQNAMDLCPGAHLEIRPGTGGSNGITMVVLWFDGDHEAAAFEWEDDSLYRVLIPLARQIYVSLA